VDDPFKENPVILRAIISAGGCVQYVTRLNPDLEKAYLKIMEEVK